MYSHNMVSHQSHMDTRTGTHTHTNTHTQTDSQRKLFTKHRLHYIKAEITLFQGQ